ncbi:hypothetical protein HPB47_022920 [Ixodes persulcatus]|uniref:Uncharacterized protein n=1 Tax=Ixodes persulcatus TaxID=34615 RepID=A0AC60Q8C9_IXOPE|nr:hypothetical protein HPB47_022920 [Ixodes persulcatus]
MTPSRSCVQKGLLRAYAPRDTSCEDLATPKRHLRPWLVNCDLCGASQTLQHVLVHCSDAYLSWDKMTMLQLRTAFDVECANFKYPDLREMDTSQVRCLLLFLCLHSIWQSRIALVQCPTWDYFMAKLNWVFSVTERQPDTLTDQWQCVQKQVEDEGRRRECPLPRDENYQLPSGDAA